MPHQFHQPTYFKCSYWSSIKSSQLPASPTALSASSIFSFLLCLMIPIHIWTHSILRALPLCPISWSACPSVILGQISVFTGYVTHRNDCCSHTSSLFPSPFLQMEAEIQVFSDGTLCHWVGSSWRFKDHNDVSFRFTILSNAGNCTPNGTASHSRWIWHLATPPECVKSCTAVYCWMVNKFHWNL